MIVFIKTLQEKYTFYVSPDFSVLHLKYQIQDELHMDIRQQRLIFNGYTMADENTLQKLGVTNNSIIHLLFSLF